MNFQEYSEKAISTAMYPNKGNNLYYPALGLAGESGEVCDKIKKIMRDKQGNFTSADSLGIALELGDILWYINALADEIGIPLETIAQINIDKLQSRKSRGKLGGSGDSR